LLLATQPRDRLRFRNLAWEGDTVFEQRRDLNYPPLEQQLTKVGATVLVAQFGAMEALQGTSRRAFGEAYGRLLDRLGSRRFILIAPTGFSRPASGALPDHTKENGVIKLFGDEVERLARERHARFVPAIASDEGSMRSDGVHLSIEGQRQLAMEVARRLATPGGAIPGRAETPTPNAAESALRKQIVAKNGLWFHYYRPQNWAFLAGDRTSQPSSRDHRDPNKRWFPDELEQFLPLIEKKEGEIWRAAQELRVP